MFRGGTYINTVGAQFLKALLDRLDDLLAAVITGVDGIVNLGGEGEPSVFPPGFSSEGFLLLVTVHTCSIQFVIASGLKYIQDIVKGTQVCDPGAISFRISKGHQTKDDAIIHLSWDKGHIRLVVKRGCYLQEDRWRSGYCNDRSIRTTKSV